MNKDISVIKDQAVKIIAFLKQHFKLIMVLVIVAIFGFLVLKISELTQKEPSQEAVSEKLEKIKKPTVDEKTAEKLRALEDYNQEVKALFEAARENPFQE